MSPLLRTLFSFIFVFFFFNDTSTTEIYTLSLHDALPIYHGHDIRRPYRLRQSSRQSCTERSLSWGKLFRSYQLVRSEEHTSELQSRRDLVCRLLLEKKKQT